jgi:predicted nucleic acid-binding protein
VYLFDRDEPRKSQKAHVLLQQHDDLDFAISTQVLQEFYFAVTGKLKTPVPLEQAAQAVQDLRQLAVQQITPDMIIAAISLSRNDGFSFWDALIVEAALRSGAQQLLSEDMQDGRVVEGLEIRNPFVH